jgi:hypothetical protein
MEKLKEFEIREESLQLVVETYRVVQLLPAEFDQKVKIKMLNTSFKVSSFIADTYAAIQNEVAEKNISSALKNLKRLNRVISRLSKQNLIGQVNLETLKSIAHEIQEDLEIFLASIQVNKLDQFSPKLEKTCI